MGRHVADSPVDTDRLGAWVRMHLDDPGHVAEPEPLLNELARRTTVAEYRGLGIDPALIDIIEGTATPQKPARAHVAFSYTGFELGAI